MSDTPSFPDNISGVESLSWSAVPQVIITDSESSPKDFKRISRVPAATASVSWRFLDNDFAIFQDFWKNDLIRGHRWFSLILPSGAGYVPHIVRFIKHRVAKRDGFGYWTVTAELYVRERRRKVIEVEMCFVSWPYPLFVEESLDGSHGLVSGQMIESTLDLMDGTHGFVSGDLRLVLQSYDSPLEEMDGVHSFDSGVLTTVLLTYTNPFEDLDSTHSLSSAVLTTVLITYPYYEVESMDATHGFVSGVLS